jgi:hypothetical protein
VPVLCHQAVMASITACSDFKPSRPLLHHVYCQLQPFDVLTMVFADMDGVVDNSQTTDQQGSLATNITQVQKARGDVQQSPFITKNDEDGQVFLCGYFSADSFVGLLDDRESITDEEVEDFIRRNNPEMFHRLFRGIKTFAEAQIQNGRAGYDMSISAAKLDTTPADHGVDIFISTPKFFELQHVLLQVKRLVLSALLGKSAHSLPRNVPNTGQAAMFSCYRNCESPVTFYAVTLTVNS